MKKKELLQKSSTVAAVVLAAALMDPTAAQASAMDASAVSSSSQVLEQSVSSDSGNAVETETAESQEVADETNSNIQDLSAAESTLETPASSEADTAETSVSESPEIEAASDETVSDDVSNASDVSTQDDFTPGWNTDADGNVSYKDENGVFCQNEIREIDGKKYYFDENCHLVKDTEFSYDTSDSTSHTFRAQEDGSLLIDGWYDKSYFDENGHKCYYCVKKINGIYYGFDNDGNMFDDCAFWIHDYSDAETKSYRYRALPGGVLCADCWSTTEYGEECYYGSDAAAYTGLIERNGIQIAVIDGIPCRNSDFSFDGKYYWANDDYTLTELKSNDWTYIDSNSCRGYRYVKDGKILKDCIEKIGDNYYHFDYNGVLSQNTYFYYTDESGTGSFYYAQDDGTFLCNGWVELSLGSYYFGADGKGLNGLQRVDGKLYYFISGHASQNTSVSVDGKSYICLDDCSVIEAKNNGWTLADGYYYYMKNGNPLTYCTEKIGNAYYGFKSNGQMYSNTVFYIYNNKYKASADGSLLLNKWDRDSDNHTYYYGSDGVPCTGLQTIDGKLYYFDTYGYLFIGTPADNKVTVDGKDYFADENGVLSETDSNVTSNGWLQKNGSWYYIKDHKILTSCVEKIGAYYYCFDSNGVMQTNGVVTIWNPSAKTYYADENGHLKKNFWFSRSRELTFDKGNTEPNLYNQILYFGDNFESCSGFQTIDGKLYYFASHNMVDAPSLITDTTVTVDQKNYLCLQDGAVVELKDNDWTFAEDNQYYVKDHTILKNCVAKIDGNYYGFQSDGKMYNNTRFTITDPNDHSVSSTYFAQKGGVLAIDKNITIDGTSYYFGSDGIAYTGIRTIDGKKYYYEKGFLRKSCILDVDGHNYIALSSGEIQELFPGMEWVDANGSWYYIRNNKLLKNTKAKINNKWYLFSESGSMYQTNSTIFFNGVPYFVNSDGSLKVNAWGSVNGAKIYYDENGSPVSGVTTINGVKYLFSYHSYETYGQLLCNRAFCFSSLTFYDPVNYASDSAGRATRLKNNAWTKVDGFWYYVSNHSVLLNTVAQIGNSYYAFDEAGHMYAGTTFTLKGVSYTADKDGHVTFTQMQDLSDGKYSMDKNGKSYTGMKTIGQIKYYFAEGKMQKDCAFTYQNGNYVSGSDGRVLALPYNGWTEVDGHWYFVSNGTLIKNTSFTVGKNTYLFNSDGAMMTSDILWTSNGECSAADKNGIVLKNAWMQTADGSWMYFDGNGKAVNGRQTINKKKYTFYNFVLKTNRPATVNGRTYIVASNGTLKEITSDGWSKIDDYWYYFMDGNAVTSSIIQIGYSLYAFDSNGRMYENQEFSKFDYTNNYLYAQNNTYYRADANGRLIIHDSYHKDNDVYYYGAGGAAYNGYHKVNGVTWFFINGKQQKNTAFCDNDGNWYAVDYIGKLFALENNKWKQVAGHYYYVKNGTLLKNTVALINGSYYGFDSNGQMYSNQIFTDASGNTYRASASGALLRDRWYSDSIGKYYFDARGIGFEGIHLINDDRYTFANGKVTSVSYKPAWQKDSKGWWYRHADGSYTTSGWEKINGKYYLFNASGYMLTGWQKVDGKWYYMYESGAMAANTWIGNYYVGADGAMRN